MEEQVLKKEQVLKESRRITLLEYMSTCILVLLEYLSTCSYLFSILRTSLKISMQMKFAFSIKMSAWDDVIK